MGIENMSFPDEYTPDKTPREFYLKIYDWESLTSVFRDIEKAINPSDEKFKKTTGSDQSGEFKGMIRVTMEYVP